MPKQLYEGKGADLAEALQSLYRNAFGDKAPENGEEMRYRVELFSQDGTVRYTPNGVFGSYDAALDAARALLPAGSQAQDYRSEVFVTGRYESRQQSRPSGAAPSGRKTVDITGLL
ncbi:hypothetical protein HY496_02690 [Candidatus Woesearchaeota archaeon]|nr:hypothetical protein [Candidatus Woesearchaeota archaeon]